LKRFFKLTINVDGLQFRKILEQHHTLALKLNLFWRAITPTPIIPQQISCVGGLQYRCAEAPTGMTNAIVNKAVLKKLTLIFNPCCNRPMAVF
jgi:hypothetical protein